MTSKFAQAASVLRRSAGELVGRLEGGDRVELARALDDLARHRMQRVGARLDQPLGRGVALGDPGALVEQPRDLEERLDVEFDERRAERGELRRRRRRRRARRRRRRGTRAAPGLGTPMRRLRRRGDETRARRAACCRRRRRRSRRRPRTPRRRRRRRARRSRSCPACGRRARRRSPTSAPSVGFRPTMPLSAAGTRPEPAVSVPSEKGTRPAPTLTAEPELEPPGMRSARSALRGDAIGRAHADEAGRELVEIGLADRRWRRPLPGARRRRPTFPGYRRRRGRRRSSAGRRRRYCP